MSDWRPGVFTRLRGRWPRLERTGPAGKPNSGVFCKSKNKPFCDGAHKQINFEG